MHYIIVSDYLKSINTSAIGLNCHGRWKLKGKSKENVIKQLRQMPLACWLHEIHHLSNFCILSPSTLSLMMACDRHTEEYNVPSDHERECEPLLKPSNENNAIDQAVEHSVPKSIARRLYLSHFLSTWNSRVFEFGAVLYLATIYPGTLLPMSIYAFTRGLSAIVFAPALGQYIDTGDRLQVVRVSIGM